MKPARALFALLWLTAGFAPSAESLPAEPEFEAQVVAAGPAGG